MGVAAQHLVSDGGGYVVEAEQSSLLSHACVEHDLEKQIAQLILELGHVAPLDGVGDFIGLFDGVGRYGREGLLEVPGAAALGCAQPGHDGEQLFDGAGGLGIGRIFHGLFRVAGALSYGRFRGPAHLAGQLDRASIAARFSAWAMRSSE